MTTLRWPALLTFCLLTSSCLALQLAVLVPPSNKLLIRDHQRLNALALSLADFSTINVEPFFIELSEYSLDNINLVQSYIAANQSVTTAALFLTPLYDEKVIAELFINSNVRFLPFSSGFFHF